MGTAVLVLSGKGGSAKTTWQLTLAGEASRAGLRVLLCDVDPERNLSNRFRVKAHSTGLGKILQVAGVGSASTNAAAGAAELQGQIRAAQENVEAPWPNVDLLPAGAELTGVSQAVVDDLWLLRDIFEAAGTYDQYDVIFLDTGGRRGTLVSLAMYAADVAYAPIGPTQDAIQKAVEAKQRVTSVQRSHPNLRWAGVVLSGFDQRVGMDEAIKMDAIELWGDEVRAQVPRRAVVHEAFQLCERIGDRQDVPSQGLAKVFGDFLQKDLLTKAEAAA
ncbi:ParA family protein [Pseudonocardia dioxanivorans]|uniref:ParA family protein n=1 Tax=Pseudonocardia dioxanivorans TaxID=240495 RepID=UPI000CD23851|nr:ParA family protein [Pseudonocardia dioxanivorans]